MTFSFAVLTTKHFSSITISIDKSKPKYCLKEDTSRNRMNCTVAVREILKVADINILNDIGNPKGLAAKFQGKIDYKERNEIYNDLAGALPTFAIIGLASVLSWIIICIIIIIHSFIHYEACVYTMHMLIKGTKTQHGINSAHRRHRKHQ